MFFVVFPNLSVTLTLIQKIMNVINVKDKRVFRNTSREMLRPFKYKRVHGSTENFH